MTDKEKQIEEMVEVIKAQSAEYNANCDKDCDDCPYGDCVGKLAEELLKVGYRKIPEGSVVLSKEEYAKDFCSQFNKGYERGSKETAREILKWLVDTGMINIAPDTTKMYFKEQFGVEVKNENY
jgi:hypothetical protein